MVVLEADLVGQTERTQRGREHVGWSVRAALRRAALARVASLAE